MILQDSANDYFDCPMGVKQGDSLSPTLFAVFINDLADTIKNSGVGVTIEAEDIAGIDEVTLVNILLYADDIVLLSENECDMQRLLDMVQEWCENWRLEVNLSKTNILHVRPKRKAQSKFMFLFNKRPVPYCTNYKYLGCYITEHLDYMFSVDRQVDSAGRALSAIISKMIKNKGLPFNVYSTLYFACVSSISLYGCEVFGFQHSNSMLKLQLRASRAYLGLPKTTASCGLISEFDWLLPKYQSYLKMIQFFGRIMLTSSHRLLYKVYKWDRGLND